MYENNMYNMQDDRMDIEHNCSYMEVEDDIEDGKRSYCSRDFGIKVCESPVRKQVKFSDDFINANIYSLLKMLFRSSNLVIDLTIMVPINSSSLCAFMYYNGTLFICRNSMNNSYEAMKIMLKSISNQNVTIIFDDSYGVDILKNFLSFSHAKLSLVFCGKMAQFSNACSLNGLYKSWKACDHFFNSNLNSDDLLTRAKRHMLFGSESKIKNSIKCL